MSGETLRGCREASQRDELFHDWPREPSRLQAHHSKPRRVRCIAWFTTRNDANLVTQVGAGGSDGCRVGRDSPDPSGRRVFGRDEYDPRPNTIRRTPMRPLIRSIFSARTPVENATLRFDRAMKPSIVVAVVTNRPDLLERHALGGVGESTKAGIAALIVDQSPEGGAEALARSAGAGYLRSGQGLSIGRNLAVRLD